MELEETAYRLELLAEAEIVPAIRLKELRKESDELTAILITIINKTKGRRENKA